MTFIQCYTFSFILSDALLSRTHLAVAKETPLSLFRTLRWSRLSNLSVLNCPPSLPSLPETQTLHQSLTDTHIDASFTESSRKEEIVEQAKMETVPRSKNHIAQIKVV